MRHVKFNINVLGNKNTYWVTYLDDKKLGLKHIDRIRNELNVPLLPLTRIYHEISGIRKSCVTIEVSEFYARNAQHFWEKPIAKIRVPEAYMSRFYKEVVEATRDDETGEVVEARIVYKFDSDLFLEWWKSEGYPLEVNEDTEEKEE